MRIDQHLRYCILFRGKDVSGESLDLARELMSGLTNIEICMRVYCKLCNGFALRCSLLGNMNGYFDGLNRNMISTISFRRATAAPVHASTSNASCKIVNEMSPPTNDDKIRTGCVCHCSRESAVVNSDSGRTHSRPLIDARLLIPMRSYWETDNDLDSRSIPIIEA